MAEDRGLVNEGMRRRLALETLSGQHDKLENTLGIEDWQRGTLRESLPQPREVPLWQGCRSEQKMPRYILLLHAQGSAGDYLETHLHQLGFEIQVARSAQEAIEIAQFQKFDILIANVDGGEISWLERMRGQQSSLKAIALCDLNRYERKKEIRKTSFDKYAQRDNFSSVKAAIEELFERRAG